jgi:UDP-N-acetylmuramate--alanine ligase
LAGGLVYSGHSPDHVREARAVVVSSAVPRDHPELESARALGIPVIRRAEALAAAISTGKVVAIAGTHGKTTTTVMTTEALAAAGLNPTGIAGGRVAHWGGNALVGGDSCFVVEADEYDKSFLALKAQVAVINNVEPDHLECYGDVGALEEAFADFARPASRLIVSADDEGARRVALMLGARTWTFGLRAGADFRVAVGERGALGSLATVSLPTGGTVELRLSVPGLHNVMNAAAALAVSVELGADLGPVCEALTRFGGVGRRFELVGESRGVTVVDDYAHHETEIASTIEAARQAYPGRRLVAVFQPHLYSRTRDHGEAMGRALAGADVVVVTDVYAAREPAIDGVSGKLVVAGARAGGVEAIWAGDRSTLVDEVAGVAREGDVILVMGAGDVTAVARALPSALAARK